MTTKKKKLVVLSGAGVSAESGIPTFRDANGLWEGHDVREVASPQGWAKNKALVLDFYNQRRKQALTVKPNEGHKVIAELEQYFEVVVITQNIDDLHEQAGSSHIVHLHGEIFKVQSTLDPELIYPINKINSNGWELKIGDKCEKGSQLRPFIVWFGEPVPMISTAAEHCIEADIFVVVGTSMVVYPAAGLIDYVPKKSPKFIVDPQKPDIYFAPKNLTFIEEKGTVGMPQLKKILLEQHL